MGGTKACPATENLFKVREDEDRVLLCEDLYGMLKAALLLYQRLRFDLEEWVL